MTILLDSTATMPVHPQVLSRYIHLLESTPGNPSSRHHQGQAAAQVIQEARSRLAAVFDCEAADLIFTSGGSESINTVLRGCWQLAAKRSADRPFRLLTTAGEHDATRETARILAQTGGQIETCRLTAQGTADLAHFETLLQQARFDLISLIYVSNETGAVNPIEEMVRLSRTWQPTTPIHLDGVQATGKFPWSFRQLGVDYFSGSGHKIASPKGVGWLIGRHKLQLPALISGAAQQNSRRAGTENAPLADALALAAELASQDLTQKDQQVRGLRQFFLDELTRQGTPHHVISPDDGVPHILSIAFLGLRGETLRNILSDQDILVSVGSACSATASKAAGNQVLTAMGVAKALQEDAIRISLTADLSEQALQRTASAIQQACRQFGRKSAL